MAINSVSRSSQSVAIFNKASLQLERLLAQEGLSIAKANDVFKSIISNMSSMYTKSNDEKKIIAKLVVEGIKELILFTDVALRKLELTHSELRSQLIGETERFANATERVKEVQLVIDEISAKLAGLNEKKRQAEKLCKNTEWKMSLLRTQIAKERTQRNDTLLDFNPVIGAAKKSIAYTMKNTSPSTALKYGRDLAIMCNGRPKKVAFFAAATTATIASTVLCYKAAQFASSLYQQSTLELELKTHTDLVRNLSEEIKVVADELSKPQGHLDTLKTHVYTLKTAIAPLEVGLKTIGKEVVTVRHANNCLQKISNRYQLHKADIEFRIEMVDVGLLEDGEVQSILNSLIRLD